MIDGCYEQFISYEDSDDSSTDSDDSIYKTPVKYSIDDCSNSPSENGDKDYNSSNGIGNTTQSGHSKVTGIRNVGFRKFGDTCLCSSCSQRFNLETPCIELICGHSFHINCLKDLLSKKKNCPVCGAAFINEAVFTAAKI